jgi:hypothetical protein
MITVLLVLPTTVPPTAQALRAEKAATEFRAVPAGVELGTRFHAEPIQRTIKGLGLQILPAYPTAQALLLEEAATELRAPRVEKDVAETAGPALPAAKAAAGTQATTAATNSEATTRMARELTWLPMLVTFS